MNNKIIIAAVVITASGIANAWLANPPKPVTGILIGGYIFLIVLAIVDTFGGPFSNLSSALAMVAVVYVLLHVFPWTTLYNLVSGKKA